jgi:probable F420-dependent oxidoreductase
MRVGVILPSFSQLGTRELVLEVTCEAEALGYDAIWTTDHVLIPRQFPEPYGHILEALVTLAYVAPLTQRVRLGISVLVLPQREPVLVAKQIATLDYLSGGRLILGVGAGWAEGEFRFLRARFDDRGPRMDEYLRVLRTLWREPEPQLEGAYVRISDALFSPRPVQPHGPPIWIGGSSPAALRRAAELGDGWHPVGVSPAAVADGMRRIRELAKGRRVIGTLRIRVAVGRTLPEQRNASGQPLAALSGSPDELIERLEAYRVAGVEELALHFGDTNDRASLLADMRRFADEVRPRVRAAAPRDGSGPQPR